MIPSHLKVYGECINSSREKIVVAYPALPTLKARIFKKRKFQHLSLTVV